MKESGRRSIFSGLIPLFVLAHFAHHLMTALTAPLLPFIRNDFKLDYTQASLVASSFGLSNGIGQLPAGWLADRIGPRILIFIGICGAALAGILVGLSQTYLMMIVFLVLMGLAGGGYHPAGTPMVSALAAPEKRGRALGFHAIGGSASFFLAPIIAAAIAATWGWRGAFIGLAIPAAVFGIILYALLGRRAGISQVQPVKAEHRDVTSYAPGRWRQMIAFMILIVLAGGAAISIIAFIPLYLVDHFGVSEQTAASLLAIIHSAGLWAGLLGGYLSDRVGTIPVILVNFFITGLVIYLINLAPYGLGFGALLLFYGITMSVRMPVAEAYIMGHTTERHRSTIYGIYYFSMMETGAALAPVMGYLIDNFGFHFSFTIASVAIVAITLICAVFLWGSRD